VELAVGMAELKKDWTLKPEAFRQLLSWLDGGSDSGGETYVEVRRRLRSYFERKNCLSCDELADETLNRIARKLEEKGAITDVSALHYCYIVAKFVFLESLRQTKLIRAGTTELRSSHSETTSFSEVSEIAPDEPREKIHGCLEKCLKRLTKEERELILEYYRGQQRTKIEHRSDLAARLGLSKNALSIRACRIRNKLEACVRACVAGRT
jgi:DNA-directed RNA polymerase specialized sigma24 family protein